MDTQIKSLRDHLAERMADGREYTSQELVDHMHRIGWVGVTKPVLERSLKEIGARRKPEAKGYAVWQWREVQ